MNYSFEYIDIILLAMIAGFIVLRLRGILGKRTGFEGKTPAQFENILKKVHQEKKTKQNENFDAEAQKEFLKGAKIAYETIITDFSDNDNKLIASKPLLSKKIYDEFNKALIERGQRGHFAEITFIGINSADIKEYKKIELSHMLADNCAMQLLRDPKQFDVIVTDNLFGDILSDEAAMLTGSLGLLPSASLGAKDKNGKIRSMYEPVHGSAPDIAGKNIANPIATILSLSMALKYSLDLDKEAEQLDKAVQSVLDDGLRTKDIMSKNMKEVTTSDMGDAIIANLK